MEFAPLNGRLVGLPNGCKTLQTNQKTYTNGSCDVHDHGPRRGKGQNTQTPHKKNQEAQGTEATRTKGGEVMRALALLVALAGFTAGVHGCYLDDSPEDCPSVFSAPSCEDTAACAPFANYCEEMQCIGRVCRAKPAHDFWSCSCDGEGMCRDGRCELFDGGPP